MEVWDCKRFENDLEHQDELIRLVLEQFLLDSEELMEQLINASASSPPQSSVTPLAHALKGAAAQVRCEALAGVCSEIEQLSKKMDASAINPTLIQQLQLQYVQAVALIRNYCSG